MSASLVGSEMCIRDRAGPTSLVEASRDQAPSPDMALRAGGDARRTEVQGCLLYTSDAADDM
eukprot:7265546-Alexandrium_andersonii.AAC.1